MKKKYPELENEVLAVIAVEPNKNHKTILNKFFTDYPEKLDERDRMENLRNKFSHNEYPDYSLFKNYVQEYKIGEEGNISGLTKEENIAGVWHDEKSLAKQLLKFTQETYGMFIKKLTV